MAQIASTAEENNLHSPEWWDKLTELVFEGKKAAIEAKKK